MYSTLSLDSRRHYGVVLDAGSSGTRVHVYRWLDHTVARKQADTDELKTLPELKTKPEWTKKIHPGVSSFAERPEAIGPDHLAELLDHARKIVPASEIKDTPIFLLATAGMRLLPNLERELLLNQICTYANENYDFLLPDCGVHIQVIPGVTEALYGWIATNYLLGSFDEPKGHDHGKGHHTYGFLDMGGASAQIAFAPNITETEKHADDLTLLRLRNVDGSTQEHRVFVTSWLEYGVHEARRRYLEALQTALGSAKELPDPCLPQGLRTTIDGKPMPSDGKVELSLLGTGRFDECLRQTYPLLDKDAPCADQPCLLHGVHVPAIDFDVNHFIGISEYWHTTHEILEMGHKDKAYDFNTYQQRVQQFCSQDWEAIEKGVEKHKWGKKVDQQSAYEVCFKASWIINMLHDGIGIPRVGLEDTTGSGHNGTKEVLSHGKNKGFLDPFQAVHKIDSTEVSWTLGKMVLYASSQVPTESEEVLPVGFGSNVAGVPNDFQYPSVELFPNTETLHGSNWQDALFDGSSPRRAPGFVLFLLIVAMAAFFLCGRSRRSRMFHKFNTLFKRGGPSRANYPKRRGFFGGKLPFFGRRSPSYERVLEDGAREYDLGASHFGRASLDRRHSSETDSSSFMPPKRTSSWSGPATPSFKFSLDNSSTATIGLGISADSGVNAIDRAGLVVRTESRDHLAPVALGPTTNGRRSRAGSPTRSHRTPITSPLAED
ncbi:putative nucleoside diphosphatase (Ynd1) [Aspergillus clavatus NRRL 1]|uniref:Nucleoside diphosphatase (Ynd1), putative n=1 Tax=Aspergillus clavatus (strain ATCC 1007 / CBS 513.65 / DSM 816 / NCTC 3887 / NRRL 1 / QM 1276 / 107) TaxID=344612 RepID=A1CB50_ASPCL|nr:nucleoside diphosphatase (Ynd1), putative [Aspergillus clavatus NRRL 1]EAW12968.1 nucleoside diphosphatase (Ynd1), putative [Aspergillus clavatus NRRL 1]